MRNTRIRKSPLTYEGGSNVHKRGMIRVTTVCEQGYFTRYTAGKSKPEVQR
ncbi:MAG: hypothetical protein IJQ08_01815 [Synergistaceae bacterium]|nr:hypothetical protein [Synergistaceae bacterium]